MTGAGAPAPSTPAPSADALAERRREVIAALWPDRAKAPSRVLACRHCGRPNRVDVPVAALEPHRCDCGACGGRLFLAPDEPLTALPSSAYEHSLDRRSLEALRAIPGFPAAVKFLLSNLGERSARLLFLSSFVRCGDDQFPELAALLGTACRRLAMAQRPTLFLGESPHMNAFTTGVEERLIVVQAGLLDQLDDAEVVAVLAHELGHIHADHLLYQTLAQVLLAGGAALSGIGALLSWPLQQALRKWSRCAELTCDRASLLGARDVPAALGVLVKLAGGARPGTTARTRLRLAPYLRQARDLAALEAGSVLDGLLANALTLGASHPFVAWRVMHLVQWIEQGEYLEILAGSYAGAPSRPASAPAASAAPA